MTATIIPFPVRAVRPPVKRMSEAKLRALAEALRPSPDERREMDARRGRPLHWTEHDHYIFDHLKRCDGLTNEQAARQIELDINIRREVPGEDESARLLRMARESMARLKKIK